MSSATSMILVTGGAGYIGSHTVLALARAGRPVLVLDDLSTGHRDAVPAAAPLIEGTLADRALLADVFARHKISAILHFAARSIVGDSMRDPVTYLRDNAAEFLNLIEIAAKHGAPPIVLSSTAALFGRPDRDPIDEECRIEPGNPYGESKLYAERALYWAEQAYGLRSIALRYFNAAGADADGSIGEDHRPETHLIPIILEVASGKRSHVAILGDDYATPDGTAIRDYVHVEDLVDAHVRVMNAIKPGQHRVYNVGTGRGASVLEVLRAVQQVTGVGIPTRVLGRRSGDAARAVANASCIMRELDWKPCLPHLPDMIASAWSWVRRHPGGYAS